MSDNPIEQGFLDVHYAHPIPPEYVIAEVAPVGLTILSGAPKKSFKSLQTILFAAACAQWHNLCLPVWMKAQRTGPSLLVSYEATAGVINYILENDCQIQTSPGSLYVAHAPFKFQLDNPAQANELLDYMDEKEPVMVVLDPFRNTHSGDENDSGNVMNLLSPLVEWGHNHKAAIILVHHVNKPNENKDGSSFYAMRGSSALPGLADGLLLIEPTKSEGDIYINATFKRGLSYRRQVHLGVPGFGWGHRGYEIFDPPTAKVQQEWERVKNIPPLQGVNIIAATLKMATGQVKESLDALRRNGLL